MKKVIYILMLVVMLALSACTADTQSEDAAAKEVSQQKWTYKLITQTCSYNSEKNDIVCKDNATKEETMLANIIGSQAADGYELDEVLTVPKNNKNYVSTFIFRKEYTETTETTQE